MQLLVGLGVNEKRDAERGRSRQHRSGLWGVQEQLAPGALDENAFQAQLLHRPCELPGADLSAKGVDGGQRMNLPGMLGGEIRQFIIDPGDHAGRYLAVRILEEGGWRIDHAGRYARDLQRAEQSGGIGEIAVHQLLRWRRGVGCDGEGWADIVIMEIDYLKRPDVSAFLLGLRRCGKAHARRASGDSAQDMTTIEPSGVLFRHGALLSRKVFCG